MPQMFRREIAAQLQQNRPKQYQELLRANRLQAHLDEEAERAGNLHETMQRQYLDRNPVPAEASHETRAKALAHADRFATEIVFDQVVNQPDPETQRAMERGGY